MTATAPRPAASGGHRIDRVWLTADARQRLVEELTHLENEVIPQAEEALGVAMATSSNQLDNGDLTAANEELSLANRRAEQIRTILAASAEAAAPKVTHQAGVGCVVVIEDGGSHDTYLIAPPENRMPGVTCLSPRSPLGQALLGAEAGATVTYKSPAGPRTVKLVEVRPYTD